MTTSELTNFKTVLKEALKRQLPGENAHRLLLPPGRELHPITDKNVILESSVLVLLFPYQGRINTCLIRRPSTMRNHGGQIAFPGGRFETTDENLTQTALRESFEEIGTASNQLEVIGALTPLYVQVSNFTINPFIAWSESIPIFKTDTREVEELFILPIEEILHQSKRQVQKVNTIHGTFDAPGFYIDQLFIWGATAMILSEFHEIFKTLTCKQLKY